MMIEVEDGADHLKVLRFSEKTYLIHSIFVYYCIMNLNYV